MTELCRVCGHTEAWHKANGALHGFSTESGVPRIPEPITPEAPPIRPDLVLRLVLIEKGILTEADLSKMELMEKLMRGGPRGEVDDQAQEQAQEIHLWTAGFPEVPDAGQGARGEREGESTSTAQQGQTLTLFVQSDRGEGEPGAGEEQDA